MDGLLSGDFTVEDFRIYDYMRDLWQSEEIFIEPSACAAFKGVLGLEYFHDGRAYLEVHNFTEYMENAVHIVRATGGMLWPSK